MSNLKDRVLIVVNVDWFFLLHRVPIGKALKKEFKEVYVVAKDTGRKSEIENLGFKFINIDFNRKSLNPITEIKILFKLYKVFKQLKPSIVHSITIKPIIYGLFVSKLYKVKLVNTVCGLGYVFTYSQNYFLKHFIILIYKFAFNKSKSFTFFENNTDLELFQKFNIKHNSNTFRLIHGVGVDLNKFKTQTKFKLKDKLNIILPSRMLWSKGVKEFIAAAILLEKDFKGKVFFKLYGGLDQGNRDAIANKYLNNIEIKDYLQWFGFQKDMISVYKDSDIVVLPSYREGLSVSLMEGCAMGKPIVTTNAVGCRECVDDGVNGHIIPIKSIVELAEAIKKLILSSEDRLIMGRNSRIKAEKEFDQSVIVKKYITVFNSIKDE